MVFAKKITFLAFFGTFWSNFSKIVDLSQTPACIAMCSPLLLFFQLGKVDKTKAMGFFTFLVKILKTIA